ncbi:MAG: hypothetical protein BGO12_07800 [Verrucomicrobia bacterium 61-8]|nr:type II and III secretion system protein [Verrucomicrobiota bacterium]OJV00570.1 MAG: hypothetical protein BGO12_07800 [Verrucomicrobia bacterium 61-8]
MIFQNSTRIARSSLALWVVFTSAFFPVLSRAQQGAVAATADREIVRRQEGLVVADKLIAKGDAAMASKDYETAYLSYMDALALVPPGGATQKDHAKLLNQFSQASLSYAQWLVSQGRYSDAEKVAKTVLLPEYNPGYKPAAQFLANLEQPDYYNKTVTPPSAADVQKVTKLLYEADGYYQSGRYDLAILRYEQVLQIDRYNIAARKGMEAVNLERSKYQGAAYDETRGRLLWLVESAWERPVHGLKDRSTEDASRTRGGARDTAQITAKLNRIIIPRLDLQDETVQDAVERLKQMSRQLDTSTDDPKAKRGVNIVLKLEPSSPPPVADPSATPAEGATPSAPPAATADTKVTLSLANVPLIEALRYLTELAGLKFKIEQYAVSIVPLSENIEDLVSKEYRVPAGFIPASSASSDSTPTAGRIAATVSDSRLSGRQTAMDYLQKEGVQFPAGAFAQYIPAGSRLIVRNTPDAIDFIDSLVDAAVGVQPTQVEIESKFLEISQNNLSELGFDWLLGPFAIGSSGVYGAGGTRGGDATLTDTYYSNFPFGSTGTNPVTSGNRSGVGTSVNSAITANSIDALIAGVPQGSSVLSPGIFGISGIFSNPQFQVVIRALNQKKGIDLMSAPKVVAKSGRKAIVRVAREFPYPTEFNPPEVPQAQQGVSVQSTTVAGLISVSGVVTPTTPTAFETRNLGVTLEVLPQIGPDGYTIDLDLSPEVVEFDGFVNYGSPIIGPTFNSLTLSYGTYEVTPNVINQPIFSTRKVTTSVSIWDGQTVTLGGLIREDVQKVQDKVPLIGDVPLVGRLFRSNVDQKIKRNLIIFVTAHLLDAEGKPLRQDFEEDEVTEPLGLPEDLPAPNIEFGKSFGK